MRHESLNNSISQNLVRTSSQDKDAMRKSVKDKIQNYLDAIIELKAQLNSLSPISRLPPEVLTEIFIQHARDIHLPHDVSALSPYLTRQILVSHVCRHWYAVALNCPRLWNSIILPAPREWILAMLSRSKRTPLSVTLMKSSNLRSPRRQELIELLQIVFAEMPRIRELRLKSSRALKGATRAVLGPAPLLELLVLDGGTREPGDDFMDVDSFFKMNPFFNFVFGDGAPSLQILEIAPFKWQPGFFHPYLKHLRLVSEYNCNTVIGDIIAVLGSMPFLETLVMNHSFPENIPIAGPGGVIVTLPHLKSIDLISKTLICANLLTHLALPSSVTVTIEGRLLDPLIPFTSAIGQLSGLSEVQYLSICARREHYREPLILKFRDKAPISQSLSQDLVDSSLKLHLTIHVDLVDPIDGMGVLVAICKHLPLTGVRKLETNCICVLDNPAAAEAFSQSFCNVRTLRLIDLPIFAVDVRQPHGHQRGEDICSQCLFPGLEVLELVSTRGHIIGHTSQSLFDELQRLLVKRYKHGHEIHKVLFVVPTNIYHEMAKLPEIVVGYHVGVEYLLEENTEESSSEKSSSEESSSEESSSEED